MKIKTSVAELLDAGVSRSNMRSSATNVVPPQTTHQTVPKRVAASAASHLDKIFMAVKNIRRREGHWHVGTNPLPAGGSQPTETTSACTYPRSVNHKRPLPHPAKHTSTIERETSRQIRPKGLEGRHRRERSWSTEMMFGCET